MQEHTLTVQSTTTYKYEQGYLLIKEVYTGEELKERFGVEQLTEELRIPAESKAVGMKEGEEKVFVTEKVTVLTSENDPPHWWDEFNYPQWTWHRVDWTIRDGWIYEDLYPINLVWRNVRLYKVKAVIRDKDWVKPYQWWEYVYDREEGWIEGDGMGDYVIGPLGRNHTVLWQMSDGNVVANAHRDKPWTHVPVSYFEEVEEEIAGFFAKDDREWRVYDDSYDLDNICEDNDLRICEGYCNGLCTQITEGPWPATWYVPVDYKKIQRAVDIAHAGDIIIVKNGIYNESIVVNKSITLRGEDRDNTIIDGGGNDDVVKVIADGCEISGFTVRNSGTYDAGIYLYSEDNVITNNNASNNYYGIYLWSSSNNTITSNIANSNMCNGIRLYSPIIIGSLNLSSNEEYITPSSSYNNITNNFISNNQGHGVNILHESHNNLIYHNNLIENTYQACDYGYNNLWDNGPIEGGNYWNDHVCEGNPSGGLQPYYIEPNGVDHYPFENKNGWIPQIYVDDDFIDDPENHQWNTIQEGINDATDGGTVYVYSGLYVENVVVDKPITLRGEDRDNTIVDGGGNGDVVKVVADGCEISGFTVRNSGTYDAGIFLYYSENNIVTNNNASNNDYGIYLCSSNNNLITSNIANLNIYYGIYLWSSSNNNITNNLANSNNEHGIYLYYSDNSNILTDNNASNNYDGIYLQYSSSNTITNNLANSNSHFGICIYSSSCNMITNNLANSNNNRGIRIYSSSSNTITNNLTNSNTYYGIYLDYSSSNTLTSNTANSNNDHGIYLWSSSNNNITNNIANANNDSGIYLRYSSNNKIYLNNFLNNTDNVDSSDYTNIWNSTEKITYTYNGTTYESYLGNYWGDYKEKYPGAEEIDECGIWNTPYSINLDTDNYPLMVPWENYRLMPARFASGFYDYGKETDGDSLYDYLVIEKEINVLEAGDYRVSASLYSPSDDYIDSDSNYTTLSAGLHNVTLKFQGWMIYKTEESGNFDVKMSLYYYSPTLTAKIDSMENTTSYYSYTEFEPPPAEFNDQYGDSGEGTDGDGLYNYLVIDVGVNVTAAGDYKVSGTLYENGTYNYVDHAYNITYLTTGNHTVPLKFEGIKIRQNEYNGTYDLKYLYLYDGAYNQLDYENYTYTTSYYNYTEFQLPIPDAYEPDNNFSLANYISVDGKKQTHDFHVPGDHDWMKFNATKGNSYTIETSELGDESDTYLYFYDTDGITEIDNDDDNGIGLASKIVWNCSISGTYYLMVQHYSSSAFGPETRYTISVTEKEAIFDTGSPLNPYPSIMGTHNGTIKPNQTITVSKLYTYPCSGTGGHTESIKLYKNGTLIASGSWDGYQGDHHNITIHNLTGGTQYVTLLENHEYNYTIITGSYPQIHHNTSLLTTNGWINCTSFVDANGKKYDNWIPAIKLE
ncbi:MAG: NosD domain-containing protein [Halobacteriota archaeon]